jgi:hypothetical protein
MEQIAAADRVYLSEGTARLVDGYFRVRDLGPTTVKGVREPIRVYQLEDVGALRTRLDVSRRRGFSRFVGRASEMAALDAALAGPTRPPASGISARRHRLLVEMGAAGRAEEVRGSWERADAATGSAFSPVPVCRRRSC